MCGQRWLSSVIKKTACYDAQIPTFEFRAASSSMALIRRSLCLHDPPPFWVMNLFGKNNLQQCYSSILLRGCIFRSGRKLETLSLESRLTACGEAPALRTSPAIIAIPRPGVACAQESAKLSHKRTSREGGCSCLPMQSHFVMLRFARSS